LGLWNFFKNTWGRQDFWPFFSFVCDSVKIIFFGSKILYSNSLKEFQHFRENWARWKKSFGQKIIFHFFGSKNEKTVPSLVFYHGKFPFFYQKSKKQISYLKKLFLWPYFFIRTF
jgi:hypothetical protein